MQLGLLCSFFFVAALVFASIVFAIERNEEFTGFQNMYDAMWWSIITMTSVTIYCCSSHYNILVLRGGVKKILVFLLLVKKLSPPPPLPLF